nr:RNA-directed DNA polymerase, eukaryota [Tanacetum cinerariifolium]
MVAVNHVMDIIVNHYPDVNPPSLEISNEEIFQAKGDLIKSIQTFLERFNCIPFEEKSQILFQTWETFFAIQCSQPKDSNELFQKLLKDLKELAEYDQSINMDRPIFLNSDEGHSVQDKESLENPFNEIADNESDLEPEATTDTELSGTEDIYPLAGKNTTSETQGRNDQDMFDTSILDDEEVVTEKEVSTADPVTTVGEVVTTASVEVRKGIVIQEPSETPTPTLIHSSQPSKAKDKGKAKMIEPKKPLKRKDQIMIDEEVARNLEPQMQAELEEEERLARQKEEEVNIALVAEWDNTQAMMDADCELATRLQEEEREELTIEEKSRMFLELMDKRKKHFHNQLKSKSFEEIQMLFNNNMKWIEAFVPMDTELVKGSEKAAEGSSKRAAGELEQENAKRQRIKEENEFAELNRLGFYQRNNGNSSYPDRRQTLEESLTKFMDESTKRHEENSNIIKEIRASTNAREAQDVKILKAYDHTLPQKEKDLGSFNLPCFIHNVYFDKALVDLGASVSVMLFSTYTNLGLGILSHTRLTIKLADRTIKQPRGIAENMLVRIGKFIFPIDFIILDVPVDDDVPLILGRPFLSIAYSKIDVYKRKFTLSDDHEGKSPARTLIDIPVFVGKVSILVGFFIIDEEDVTRDIVLGMPFFMKYVSCQMVMKKFVHRDKCTKVGGMMSRADAWEEVVNKQDSLWVKVIKAIYGDDGNVDINQNFGVRSCWSFIVNELRGLKNQGMDVLGYMGLKVGNRDIVSFWNDNWSGIGKAKVLFPRVFVLENCKEFNLRDNLIDSSLDRMLCRQVRRGAEQTQYEALIEMARKINLVPMGDRWIWTLEGSGDFTVASIRTKVGGMMSRPDAWEEVVNKLVAIRQRGLNGIMYWRIKIMRAFKSLMMKWVWRFHNQQDSLWVKVIKATYEDDGNVDINQNFGIRSCWSFIVNELRGLKNQGSGDFTVASIRKIIDEKRIQTRYTKTRWIRYVPIKLNVFAWKIKTDAIPMRLNISMRGIDIQSLTCPICDGGMESSKHLFFRCELSRQIGRKIANWWNVSYVNVESYEEWLSWMTSLKFATSISLPPEAEVERLLAMPTPSPSPLTSLSPPSAGERLTRCTAPATLPSPPLPPSLYLPPVDRKDDILESEQPPRKRVCLSTLGSRYEVGESSTRGQGLHYRFANAVEAEMRHRGIGEVGYGIRDTWIDPAEEVPEMAPTTLEKVNTRVIELAEHHEHDTQDLYALLEDDQDGRTRISQRVAMDSQRVDLLMGDRMTLQETVWIVEEEAYAAREAWAHSVGLSQTVHYELQTLREQVYTQEYQLQTHQT